jgi:hypothetical protein
MQYKSRSKIKARSVFLSIALLLFFVVVGFTSVIEIKKNDLSPEESKALYGGVVDNNLHPYAGYLISYGTDSQASICGTVYLSQDIAISAAHCFQDKVITYLGYSIFNFNSDQNFLAVDRQLHPNWDGKNVEADLAVINLPKEFFEIKEYAQIGSPGYGCNYEVIGYGKTENDTSEINLNKLRKKATFCIEEIDANVFKMRGQDGGICFGDSGSPVFEKGTNKVIGVISSIVKTKQSDTNPCSVANVALARRLDVDKDGFIAASQNKYASGETQAYCQESCIEKLCFQGLTCNQEKICVGPNNSCISALGGSCSDIARLKCESGLVCASNKCVAPEKANQSQEIMVADLEFANNKINEIFTLRNVRNITIYSIVALILISVILSIKDTFKTLKSSY